MIFFVTGELLNRVIASPAQFVSFEYTRCKICVAYYIFISNTFILSIYIPQIILYNVARRQLKASD